MQLAILVFLTEVPATPPSMLPVVRLGLLALVTWFGLMAYQAQRQLSVPVCRKFQLLALCQAGLSVARLLELALGFSTWPPLVATPFVRVKLLRGFRKKLMLI